MCLNEFNNPCCEAIEKMLIQCVLTYIWYEHSINIPWLKYKGYNVLVDQFKHSRYSEEQISKNGLNCRHFKKS